jgi:membrane-bound lytic murein transglycosylase D
MVTCRGFCMYRRGRCLAAGLLLLPLVAACGSHSRTQAVKVSPAKAPAPAAAAAPLRVGPELPQAPPEDPVLTLIGESQRRFEAGQRELELGHPEAARLEFNRSVNLLVESPYGGRTEPRIREHFDRLVDRISTYELKALAQGDGFTEKRYEPALLDDLLALTTTVEPLAASALKDTVQLDLMKSRPDIPIPLNDRVLAYIELFQGRLHDFIEDGMRRGSKYLPMIQGVFRAEGLPLDLAYVPLIESAFKPNALSKASAKGVWQFMKGTGLENGLRHDWYIDERSDPEKATVAAANYLKTLVNLFDGDWHLALASYNGGPGRLQKAIKRVGQNDFWELADRPKVLPRETREYVPMILAAIVIARNPAQYGFEFEPEQQTPFETVMLPRPVDLRRIAEWSSTTIDEIQALNPELRRWTTPVKDAQYELKVPMGAGDVVSRRLDEVADGELVSLKWITVKRGQTLLTISKSLGVKKADLAEANDLGLTARLAPGQKLIVPREATVLMTARADRPVPVTESRTTVAQATELPRPAAPSGRIKSTYQVRKGDTLASIARLYKTTVASIRTWNPGMTSGSRLMAGQRLVVFAVATGATR